MSWWRYWSKPCQNQAQKSQTNLWDFKSVTKIRQWVLSSTSVQTSSSGGCVSHRWGEDPGWGRAVGGDTSGRAGALLPRRARSSLHGPPAHLPKSWEDVNTGVPFSSGVTRGRGANRRGAESVEWRCFIPSAHQTQGAGGLEPGMHLHPLWGLEGPNWGRGPAAPALR